MLTKQEWIKDKKYLSLNSDGDYVIDCPDELNIIDFHTHMSNVLPGKVSDPSIKGNKPSFLTLPELKDLDLSVPYWKKINPDEKRKGLLSVIKFSLNGYKIFKDMIRGGTYENCFKSQSDNKIKINVVLPISSKKNDRSMEALKVAKDYPDRLIAFCSVHPYDTNIKEKIFKYKELGAKGFKLKITDLELKNDYSPVIKLFEACHEAKLPVIFHTGSLTHIKQENTSKLMWKLLKSTRASIFGDLLGKLPRDFKFIFGHSGIGEYKLVADYLKKFPASYAEVSCQSADSIKYLIKNVGDERLLFGSDWPALPQAFTLSRVLLATENNKKARENILYNNACNLLDI
ncbi:TatD family hydrolase [Clostridiaceae bacterium M8S5]|nr:TatD family hydrolase [Clostridiaceae bacterium M8S5]